ncbi:tripartite ATP-independent transporter DctP family solute receptor [Nocardioides luteus]|uniref:C4-dicarboxylate ABC transporter n=1 Tax=Nocardioides luteus TaxID=1844 RepID=A0ABQ5T0N0_9ACTN|nr:TRAP transporter substrate-binding protein [Nocardioides luteus]MDR7311662.1 tripartite ATP-independent transporter DctP family solute receptor [Nocardioides luteus]GGR72652.1 C4-dicarboxylate ABC transporter [Nocardioides luteus]GLJ70000.1 C4-dicarboxylate ABC transporter [Nocardioides luteus]
MNPTSPQPVARRSLFKAGAFGAAAVAGGLALSACGGSLAGSAKSGGTKTFKLAETHPDDYPTTLGDKKFAELAEKYTDGRIKIQVYANAQLGEESDAIEQVQMGSIEMTRISSAPMGEFVPAMGLFSLPYLFDDADHLWRFLESESGKKLLGEVDGAGFKGLGYYDPGARSFYTSKKPITAPADLKGLKIRVQQSQVQIDFIKALGGSPTPMDYGEVYSSLQSGLLDGAENNEPSYYSASHYEVAKNYTLDRHMRVAEVLLINKDVWAGLPAEDQEALQKAADESAPFQREKWDAQVESDLEKLRGEGVKINEITDLAPWRAATKSVIDKHGAKLGTYLDAVEELRSA